MVDATSVLAPRRPRSGLGRVLLDSLWLCEFFEAHEAGQKWTGRYRLVEPRSQLFPTDLPTLPTSHGVDHLQLGAVSARGISDSDTGRCLLDTTYDSSTELYNPVRLQ